MKRSLKNLLMTVMILASLIGNSIQTVPAEALGIMNAISLARPDGWTNPSIMDLWGLSGSSNVYAVGFGAVGNANKPLIYEKVGGWAAQTPDLPSTPTMVSGTLEGVWAADATHVYAVGHGKSSTLDTLPLVYAKAGSSTWSSYVITLPEWSSPSLEDVWGASATNLFAVGNGLKESGSEALMLRSNGSTTWTEQPLGELPAGVSHSHLYGVWGYAAGSDLSLYAVGYASKSGSSVPLIFSSVDGGATWAADDLDLPSTSWSSGQLYAVWGSSASDIYAVGSGSLGGNFKPLVYHFNGTGWEQGFSPAMPSGWNSGELFGVWGSGPADVHLAGSLTAGGATATLLYRKRLTTGWAASNPLPSGWNTGRYESIWGAGLNDVYAGGSGFHQTGGALPLLTSAVVDGAAPGTITDLVATSGPSVGTVRLSWTAPADDAGVNRSGPVESYIIKYSTSTFSSCSGGTAYTGALPVPVTPGYTQNTIVAGPGIVEGTTYYFRVCARDEQGLVSGDGNVDSAVAAGIGAGTYDDSDSHWNWTGTWSTYNGAGPLNNTMHYTNAAGAGASIAFTGIGFTVKFARANTRGNVEVWIDGVKRNELTFSQYGASVVWQQSWTLPSSLPYDTHTVQFKNPGGGTYIDVDAITIIGPVEPGTYDDANAAWSYAGTWSTYNGAGPLNNTMHYTNSQGASASISFTGISFTLYFTKHPNRGNVEVWVDEIKRDDLMFSEYGNPMAWQQSWTLPTPLPPGTHTLQFKNPNASTATYIDVDAITIVGEPDMTPPAAISPLNAVPGPGLGEVTLNWTAVGDDGMAGTATSYEVRYSGSAITTDSAWNLATPFVNSLVPKSPGGSETLTVGGLFSASPFYFAVRAVDEEGNKSDLLSSPSASAPQPTTIVGPGTYDDGNGAWSYTGSWATYNGGGPLNNTMHYTNAAGAGASIAFTGISFTVKFAKAYTRGNVEVWIDGVKRNELTFSQYGPGVTWQQTWTLPSALTYGTHIVQFKNPGGGTYIDIDAITIIGPVEPGTYDDANAAWTYTGTWATYNGGGPLNNTMHYTNAAGAGASITFTGTSFTLNFARANTRGNVEVWIDGIKRDELTFSQYGAGVTWQQSWTLPTPLTVGTHTVQFKNPGGGTYIDIDAITVTAPPDSTPPAAIDSLNAVPGPGFGEVILSWTAVGDDGMAGTATSYEVRYSSSAITTDGAWNTATSFGNSLVPKPTGGSETLTVGGLFSATPFYFAVRAKDERANIGPVSLNSPSATATQPTTIVGPGTYDDGHGAWNFTGSWATYNGAGPLNDTMHYSSSPGAGASIAFTGISFTVRFARAYTRGNVEVWIDGIKRDELTFSQYGPGVTWQQSWTLPSALTYGTHIVQFKNPSTSVIDIDTIKIEGPADAGTYDDASPFWSYTGTWSTYNGAGPLSNTMHYTSSQGAGASITFTGTGFTLYFTRAYTRGNVEVWIDGVKRDELTFSQYGPDVTWQQSWMLPITLSDERHVVQFKNPSTSVIDIDAIVIP